MANVLVYQKHSYGISLNFIQNYSRQNKRRIIIKGLTGKMH